MAFSLGGALHGDMLQYERDKVLREYKNNEFPILVATDVAGRLLKFIMNEDTMISSIDGSFIHCNNKRGGLILNLSRQWSTMI